MGVSTSDVVARCLGSVFIVEPMFGSARKLADRLRQTCGGFESLADLSPLPISAPSEAPSEVPRAVLTEPSQTWQLVCSHERLNLVYFPQKEEVPEQALSSGRFWELCAQVLSLLQGKLDLEVNRIAAVQHIRRDTEEKAVDYLRARFFAGSLSEQFLRGLYDAEFHVNNRVEWNSGTQQCVLNRIARVKAVRPAGERDNDRCIFLELDVNTIPDAPDIRFSEEEVTLFFSGMEDMVSSVVEAIDESR